MEKDTKVDLLATAAMIQLMEASLIQEEVQRPPELIEDEAITPEIIEDVAIIATANSETTTIRKSQLIDFERNNASEPPILLQEVATATTSTVKSNSTTTSAITSNSTNTSAVTTTIRKSRFYLTASHPFFDNFIEKVDNSIADKLAIHPAYEVDWMRANDIQSTFKPIKLMGIQQVLIALIMDCSDEGDRLAVVKWWRSMTAKEMPDCLENKIKLFYARPNASNTKKSKGQQQLLRRTLAGKKIAIKSSKEIVYVGTADKKAYREAGAMTSYSGRRFKSGQRAKKKRRTSDEKPRSVHDLFDRVTRKRVALAETAVLKANLVMNRPTNANFSVEHNIGLMSYRTVATPDKTSNKISFDTPSRKKPLIIIQEGVLPEHYQKLIKAEADKRGDDFVLTPKNATPPMTQYNKALCRTKYQPLSSIIDAGVQDDTITTTAIMFDETHSDSETNILCANI